MRRRVDRHVDFEKMLRDSHVRQTSLTAGLVPSPVMNEQFFLSKRKTSPSRPRNNGGASAAGAGRTNPPLLLPRPSPPRNLQARHIFPLVHKRDDSGLLRRDNGGWTAGSDPSHWACQVVSASPPRAWLFHSQGNRAFALTRASVPQKTLTKRSVALGGFLRPASFRFLFASSCLHEALLSASPFSCSHRFLILAIRNLAHRSTPGKDYPWKWAS